MTPSSPPDPPPSSGRLLAQALGLGLAFALVGLLLGLRILAITTMPHILQPTPELEIQEVGDGLPVPHLLNWNPNLLEWLMTLRGLNIVLLVGAATLLFGALWLLALSILDPSFRLFATPSPSLPPQEIEKTEEAAPETPLDFSLSEEPERTQNAPSPGPPVAGALDTAQLGRVFLSLLMVGIPLALLWFVTGLPLPIPEPIITAIRCLGIGIALWVGFRREEGASGPSWGSCTMMGALYGVGLFALSRCAMPTPSRTLLEQFHTLGPFRSDVWNLLAGRMLFSQGIAWFGAGVLLVLLGKQRLSMGQRGGMLIVPIAAGLLALLAQQPFSAAAMGTRYDATPSVLNTAIPYDPTKPTSGIPNGHAAAAELAQRTGLTMGATSASPERSLVLFTPQNLMTTRITGYTEPGLTATPDSVPVVMDFLKKRDYQTALSWVAIKHCYDVATTHLDQTAALTTCLLDLENCPHPKQLTDGVQGMVFTCAASQENLALLDQWADESHFAHPDRDSKVLMGRMYERVGQVEKAIAWYKKAEMPRSFMARVSSSEPNFHAGVVTGVLHLNGRPLAGVRVGALPLAMKAVPRGLNQVIIGIPLNGRIKENSGAVNEVISGPVYLHDADYPDYHPRPHSLRWISAGTTTDANGAFTLNALTAGDYLLVCTLPPDTTPKPPSDPALHADNAPPVLTLDTDKPKVDLGTISLSYSH